jgi:hypothetical protein
MITCFVHVVNCIPLWSSVDVVASDVDMGDDLVAPAVIDDNDHVYLNGW